MKISVQATGLELTPALAEYIEKKIGSLDKLLGRYEKEAILVEVEVGRLTRHHRRGRVYRAEVNLAAPRLNLRAVEEGEDLRAAIDAVRDKLQREIKKFKETH